MQNLKNSYDAAIIGSGPAACVCAIRCAQLGYKVVIFGEENKHQTESVSNVPRLNLDYLHLHALLESAKLFEIASSDLKFHGIVAENLSIDLNQTLARKNKLINDINNNIQANLKKQTIDFINISAKLVNPKTIEIRSNGSVKYISAQHIILATDSRYLPLPNIHIDHQYILDGWDALNISEIPKRIAILGAGVNGLEIAGIWNRFGVEVTLLDAQETFLEILDHQISRQAYQIFSEQGLEIRLGTRVLSASVKSKKVNVEYQDIEGTHAIRVDKLIVVPGRSPNSDNLSTADANLLLDENGFVHVDEKLRTNLPDVYAIGDLTLYGPMLKHKGMAEGILVAENIAGLNTDVIKYRNMPNIINTEPEIAWVGETEQLLKSLGKQIEIEILTLNSNHKARIENKTDGLAKIITKAETKEILGFHLISSKASELISEIALAMEFSANIDDFSRFLYSHPSFSEIIFDINQSISLKN